MAGLSFNLPGLGEPPDSGSLQEYLMYSTIAITGMPMTRNMQPSFVMQLTIVNGNFKSLITIRSGRVANLSDRNIP